MEPSTGTAATAVPWTIATWLPIIIAAVSAVAATVAALIAWFAPRSAARLAEQMRSSNAQREKRENLKQYVFLTLMQERAAPFTLEAVKAFNVIDVVFSDNLLIKEAWAQVHNSRKDEHQVPPHLQQQYLNHLLKLIAEDLGLKDIRLDDLARVYSPRYVTRRLNIELLQQEHHEREMERLARQPKEDLGSSPAGGESPPKMNA